MFCPARDIFLSFTSKHGAAAVKACHFGTLRGVMQVIYLALFGVIFLPCGAVVLYSPMIVSPCTLATRRSRISLYIIEPADWRTAEKKHLQPQALFYGWGRWIRTIVVQESKSCALPLGDTPKYMTCPLYNKASKKSRQKFVCFGLRFGQQQTDIVTRRRKRKPSPTAPQYAARAPRSLTCRSVLPPPFFS